MADDRKADVFAGEGSVASKLKKQRENTQKGRSNNPTVGGDPTLDEEGNPREPQSSSDDFDSVKNDHNSPNEMEFFRPREWSGRYVGLDSQPQVGPKAPTKNLKKEI